MFLSLCRKSILVQLRRLSVVRQKSTSCWGVLVSLLPCIQSSRSSTFPREKIPYRPNKFSVKNSSIEWLYELLRFRICCEVGHKNSGCFQTNSPALIGLPIIYPAKCTGSRSHGPIFDCNFVYEVLVYTAPLELNLQDNDTIIAVVMEVAIYARKIGIIHNKIPLPQWVLFEGSPASFHEEGRNTSEKRRDKPRAANTSTSTVETYVVIKLHTVFEWNE